MCSPRRLGESTKLTHSIAAGSREPVPSEIQVLGATELKEGVFTKEELVKLWRKCGEVLHRGTFETLWSRLRYADAVEEIRAWKEKIEALLSYHAIFMADGSTTALVKLSELDGQDDLGENR
jgi:hypothetical protein